MAVKTYVGFKADFPEDDGPEEGGRPGGKELVDFVVDALRKGGFEPQDPSNREGWAWDFETRQGEFSNLSILGHVGDEDRQWLITNDCKLPFFKVLFGRKEAMESRNKFLNKFCNTIHEAFSADARFTLIKWYDEKTFDKPGDEPSDRP